MNEQREIKFRAWGCFGSSRGCEMIYDWQGSSYIEYVGFDGGNSFEIMQYTGLKDKNGREIYESDIIKSDYPWMCGVVEFGEGAQGEPADGQYPYQGWHVGIQAFAGDDVSVIGNIYENPELLEGNRREDE